MIPIITGALGTVAKGLVRGLENLEIGGGAETIQTTTYKNSSNTEKSPGD